MERLAEEIEKRKLVVLEKQERIKQKEKALQEH